MAYGYGSDVHNLAALEWVSGGLLLGSVKERGEESRTLARV